MVSTYLILLIYLQLNSKLNCQQTSPILLTSKDDKISKHLPGDIKLVDDCEELEVRFLRFAIALVFFSSSKVQLYFYDFIAAKK